MNWVRRTKRTGRCSSVKDQVETARSANSTEAGIRIAAETSAARPRRAIIMRSPNLYERSTRAQIAHRRVAGEKIEQDPERRAARSGEVGVAHQHEPRLVMGHGQQLLVEGEIGDGEIRHAALALAQHLAGTAQAQIL